MTLYRASEKPLKELKTLEYFPPPLYLYPSTYLELVHTHNIAAVKLMDYIVSLSPKHEDSKECRFAQFHNYLGSICSGDASAAEGWKRDIDILVKDDDCINGEEFQTLFQAYGKAFIELHELETFIFALEPADSKDTEDYRVLFGASKQK